MFILPPEGRSPSPSTVSLVVTLPSQSHLSKAGLTDHRATVIAGGDYAHKDVRHTETIGNDDESYSVNSVDYCEKFLRSAHLGRGLVNNQWRDQVFKKNGGDAFTGNFKLTDFGLSFS